MPAQPLAKVRYRHRRPGGTWTISNGSTRVLQQSEALVLQALRKLRAGQEVELIEIKWSS